MTSNGNDHNGSNNGNGKRSLPQAGAHPVADLPAIEGFPASEKVYVERDGLRVPVRRIQLDGGEQPFDVYDPPGPQGVDPPVGWPRLRKPWIDARLASETTGNRTQLHYARRGILTEEM